MMKIEGSASGEGMAMNEADAVKEGNMTGANWISHAAKSRKCRLLGSVAAVAAAIAFTLSAGMTVMAAETPVFLSGIASHSIVRSHHVGGFLKDMCRRVCTFEDTDGDGICDRDGCHSVHHGNGSSRCRTGDWDCVPEGDCRELYEECAPGGDCRGVYSDGNIGNNGHCVSHMDANADGMCDVCGNPWTADAVSGGEAETFDVKDFPAEMPVDSSEKVPQTQYYGGSHHNSTHYGSSHHGSGHHGGGHH